MKRNNTMRVTVGMLCVTALMSATAFAATGTPAKQPDLINGGQEQTQPQKQEAGAYMTVDGTISNVEDRGDYLWIETTNDNMGMIYTASKDVFVLNEKTGTFMEMKDLKEGMKITAIMSKHSPMTMSLPPQTPGAIGFVVRTGDASLNVDVFNSELTNQANDLKLNIGKDTMIIHQNGAKRIYTAEDLKGSELLVFYTSSTRSIPAQTTPHFVMILNTAEELKGTELPKTEEQTAGSDAKSMPAPVAYGELRSAAEAKGYQIVWTSNTKPIVLTKNDIKVELTVGSDAFTFTHNTKDIKALDRLEKMASPAKLENGKVLVSNDFLEALE